MQSLSHCSSFGLLLGRLCLSAIFIISGIGKFIDFDSNAQYMASKGLTMVPFFLVVAAIIEILGGLAILLGFKARIGAGILALYLIPVTFLFHDFWNVSGAEHLLQLIMFLKNLAIFGGLLYVVCSGAGRYSFDACCSHGDSCCKK